MKLNMGNSKNDRYKNDRHFQERIVDQQLLILNNNNFYRSFHRNGHLRAESKQCF